MYINSEKVTFSSLKPEKVVKWFTNHQLYVISKVTVSLNKKKKNICSFNAKICDFFSVTRFIKDKYLFQIGEYL